MRLALALGCFAGSARAGEAPLEPVPPEDARERPLAHAVRVETPPLIDGRLDDAIWARANVIDDFRRTEPIEGEPMSERTEVRVLYDEQAVYFAFRCYDGEPSQIVASALRRDATQRQDDRVMIMLDTFHERRSGYMFSVNPNGARYDGLLEDGGGFNQEWDGIWYAAAQVDGEGYTVEIAIPAKTLNFPRDGSTWGLNVGRGIARRNEFGRWASPFQNIFFFDVAHFGDIGGFDGLEQGLGLDVVPSVALRHVRDNRNGRLTSEGDPSLDVFYKLTPSLTSVLTVNTDFSEAEPDRRQTNLTRFSLFFPEQRDFFLQDSGIFRFADFGSRGPRDDPRVNGQPFFSRRIGIDEAGPLAIRAGGKVTGRVGPVNVGLLSTRVESHDAIDGKWLSVGRATVNLLEESSAGVIMTYGHPSENVHSKLMGADFNYRTGRFLGTQILEGTLWVQKTSSPDARDREAALGASLRYPNDRWNWELGAFEIQENFNPALGFANRTAIRDYRAKLRRRWRPGGFLRTVDVAADARLVTGTDNELQSVEARLDPFALQSDFGDELRLRAIGRREDLLEDFEIRPGIVIPRDSYRFDRVQLWIDTSRNRPYEVTLTLEYGEFFSGSSFDTLVDFEWRPNRYSALRLEYEQYDVRLPQGDFTTRLARAGVDLAFTPNLSWTNLLQWDNETDEFSVNSRLRWIVSPGRELFVVLDPFFERTDRLKLTSTTSASVLKVLWTFRF